MWTTQMFIQKAEKEKINTKSEFVFGQCGFSRQFPGQAHLCQEADYL